MKKVCSEEINQVRDLVLNNAITVVHRIEHIFFKSVETQIT